jgi:hypothetical protein
MRRLLLLALAALMLTACGTERLPKDAAAPGSTPVVPRISTPVEQLAVTVDELPGCTLEREGEFIRRQYSRSFQCQDVDRLTNLIGLHVSRDEALKFYNDRWSTAEKAQQNISRGISARPVRLDSLKVSDISATIGRAGAETEHVYCAQYTDPSGTIPIVELYGAFQYQNATGEYTAFMPNVRTCPDARAALDRTSSLARLQVKRVKDAPLVGQ